MTAEELGEPLPGRRQHNPVLRPQDVPGVRLPQQPGRSVAAVGRMGLSKVGAAVGGGSGVQGQDAPGPGAEGFGDRTALHLRVPRDDEGGDEEHLAFDGNGTADLAAHHRAGERGRREAGDATAAGEGPRVGGAQRAVDGGGEVVVVQPQGDARVGLDGAGVQRGFEVGGVGAGQGE